MYTIKQAAIRSGVSVPLLRAWERRYGIVEPPRTASGYRLYDDAAVDRLRSMRRLVGAGWSPSEAARAVLAGDPAVSGVEAEPMADAVLAPGSVADSSSPDESAIDRRRDIAQDTASQLVDRFVSAAERLDGRTLEQVLDEAFALGTFEQAVDTIVLPALAALGDAWADGRIDVAGEHAASQTVARRLSAALAAAGRGLDRPDAVVGLPSGSRHELGALAFATAARRAGVAVIYLGADVPAASWPEAIRRTGARAVVIAVPTEGDAAAADAALDALAPLGERVLRAVGGAGADAIAERNEVIRLPARIGDAATAFARLLDARPVGP